MRLRTIFAALAAFLVAALLCGGTAVLAARFIEERSSTAVSRALSIDGQSWAEVEADGLQLRLAGVAPDEATRFRALKIAGEVVDPARVLDEITVVPAVAVPPTFLVEILRNDDGVSLIGLIPAAEDRTVLRDRLETIAGGEVTDLLETADYPKPEGWDAALGFALDALDRLPRSKISVSDDRVAITAITESRDAQRRLESELSRMAPPTFKLALDLSAPRPVIAPFTLRFTAGLEGTRFDACSADTEAARERILRAAVGAGLTGKAECTIGLGVPSTTWGEAAATAIAAVGELGGGTVTFSDADVTLVAPETTPEAEFDRVVGELEAALPEAFALHAVLPEPVVPAGTGEADAGPPEFIATLSPEGQVQMRGRLADERSRSAVQSLSHGLFGTRAVNMAARLDEGLPEGWSLRVMAGIEALGRLESGSLAVQPDFLELRGITGDADARAEIARELSAALGQSANYKLDVTYDAKLDPAAALPTPDECIAAISTAITQNKISFDPGSSQIAGASRSTIDRIAEILQDCSDVPMEIAGHTDSQGRETMNLDLSQARADAVLNALMERRVLTGNLRAKGYGETVPIGDNGTEAGREENRRIEFTLLLPDEGTAAVDGTADGAADATTADAAAEGAAEAPAEGTGEAPGEATGDTSADESD